MNAMQLLTWEINTLSTLFVETAFLLEYFHSFPVRFEGQVFQAGENKAQHEGAAGGVGVGGESICQRHRDDRQSWAFLTLSRGLPAEGHSAPCSLAQMTVQLLAWVTSKVPDSTAECWVSGT